MDTLILKLQFKIKLDPNNKLLRTAVDHLFTARTAQLPKKEVWATVQNDFVQLRLAGLWGDEPEDISLLDQAQAELSRSSPSLDTSRPGLPLQQNGTQVPSSQEQEMITVVAHPPVSAPLLPSSTVDPTVLPMDLVDALNYVYFLHLLVLDTESVLPPGKSLISVLSRPLASAAHDKSKLHERVEEVVHRAFWDEALESLSDPIPAIELSRLTALYKDIHAVLVPLLPSRHPILAMLSAPPSPTLSPLISASQHLSEILYALRQRCAPMRDAQIDALIQVVNEPPKRSTSGELNYGDMASRVVEVTKGVLKVAEIMKEDLSQFVLGSLGEEQLRAVVANQAAACERELVSQLWKPPRLLDLWRTWLGALSPQDSTEVKDKSAYVKFVRRLVSALSSNFAVTCSLPVRTVSLSPSEEKTSSEEPAMPKRENELPPPFFFVTPALLQIQNLLQALVIAATLRSLVRILPSSSSEAPEESFMHRTWLLLKGTIAGTDDAKLVNLADEVVRVRGLYSDSGHIVAEEEQTIRAAVDRTLQANDPVFMLLQRRLTRSVLEHLLALDQEQPKDGRRLKELPKRVATGRPVSPLDRRKFTAPMRLDLGLDPKLVPVEMNTNEKVVVKGFEDPVLVAAVTEVVEKLRRCVEWTRRLWPDFIELQSLAEVNANLPN